MTFLLQSPIRSGVLRRSSFVKREAQDGMGGSVLTHAKYASRACSAISPRLTEPSFNVDSNEIVGGYEPSIHTKISRLASYATDTTAKRE